MRPRGEILWASFYGWPITSTALVDARQVGRGIIGRLLRWDLLLAEEPDIDQQADSEHQSECA